MDSVALVMPKRFLSHLIKHDSSEIISFAEERRHLEENTRVVSEEILIRYLMIIHVKSFHIERKYVT